MANVPSLKNVSEKAQDFSRAFFSALSALSIFKIEIPVHFAKTNAERNVYQATFLTVLEEVKDLFVLEHLPGHKNGFFDQGAFLVKTHFKYIKNFYFGDKMTVSLKAKEWKEDEKVKGFILEARYTSPIGLHTIGKQWILFSPAKEPNRMYEYDRSGDFPFAVMVTRPLVNHRCYLSTPKIAELFGNTREEMALVLLPKFLEDVRAENYGVVTRNAEYEYFKPIYRGQKVHIQMRVTALGATNASFFLQADYVTADAEGEDIVCIRAKQEIVYVNKEGKRENLPPELMAIIQFSIEQSS